MAGTIAEPGSVGKRTLGEIEGAGSLGFALLTASLL
jgi:hypothetical protein